MDNTGHTLPLTEGGSAENTPGGMDPTVLAIILACTCGAVVILIIAVIVITIRRYRRKQYESQFNGDSPTICKSLPSSRSHSPRLPKRLSCPEVSTAMPVPPMIRSATLDGVPFQLPSERVQPEGHGRQERAGSVVSLPRQQSTLGAVQPELYRPQSGSEDDDGTLPSTPHGRLWFSVLYDAAIDQIQVMLIKVKNLPGRAKSDGPRDPFVKVFLLPDEKTVKVSKVRRKTLSPIFNEMFTFQVTPDDVFRRSLRFSVYDVDKRHIRHSLGHVMVPLKDFDLTKGEPMWSDLELLAHATSSLGDIFLGLTYQPQAERIKLMVMRLRQLRHIDYGGDTGVYVKVQYYHGRRSLKTKRTALQLGAPDAEFNESFSFSIAGRQLDSCSFVVSVMTAHLGGRSHHEEEYGRTVIGPFLFARGEELMHWQDMLAQPRTPVTRWHTITSGSGFDSDR